MSERRTTAWDDVASRPAAGLGRELAAVLLLTVGSVLLPLLGWLAGAVLLWGSPRWTDREKLLGTLVLPGGLLPILLALTVPVVSCSGVSGTGADGRTTTSPEVCDGWQPPVPLALLVVLVLLGAPVLVAVVLWRRAQTRAAGAVPARYGRGAVDLPHRVALPVLVVLVAVAVAVPVRAVTARGHGGGVSVAPIGGAPSPAR